MHASAWCSRRSLHHSSARRASELLSRSSNPRASRFVGASRSPSSALPRPHFRAAASSATANLDSNREPSDDNPAVTSGLLRKKLRFAYKASKPRLTGLVCSTAVLGAALGGMDSVLTLGAVFAGTSLCSASACTLNSVSESSFDKLMVRTSARPMAAGRLSPREAHAWAALTAVGGTSLLAVATNPAVAALGAANIALYAWLYTPLKRHSPLNTEFGTIVGAIPPLMGWLASPHGDPAVQGVLTSLTAPEPVFLFAALVAWQMQHFAALAWRYREDYAAAGFRMMSHPETDPRGDTTFAKGMAWTAAMAALPVFTYMQGTTSSMFIAAGAAITLPVAWRWHQWGKDRTSSDRRFFRDTLLWGLLQLPVFLTLAVFYSSNPLPVFKKPREWAERFCVFLVGTGYAPVPVVDAIRVVSAAEAREGQQQGDDESAAAAEALLLLAAADSGSPPAGAAALTVAAAAESGSSP